jgi:hypothetical protein
MTWPFRAVRNIFRRGPTEKWAVDYLKKRRETERRPLTMEAFHSVWVEYQRGRSYISKETIEKVGEREGLSLEQMVYILCCPDYEWHWHITGWLKLLDKFKVKDYKSHILHDAEYITEYIPRDYYRDDF